MASASAWAVLRGHLEANWTATPIAWENEVFEPPEPAAPWVMAEAHGDMLDQESIGAGDDRRLNRWVEEGTLLLHVFAPAGTGATTAREHAEALADLFRGAQIGPVEFREIAIGFGRRADDKGAWWILPVSVAWRRG